MDSSVGELLLSGTKLMLVGMGIVYLFLALLVWVIGLNSKLLQCFSPEPLPQLHHPAPPVHTVGDVDGTEAEIVAVISAAIHHHQNTKRQK